jgi:redox-sensitive bicupin YhaK (pirin superfamily)
VTPPVPPAHETDSGDIDVLLQARPRDLGGFAVRRLLPSPRRRTVGPFVFLDHMGPATLPPGVGFDVPPHPHIGLATVTYLFVGEVLHRDSLGTTQTIRPGDVNWMCAGRGIVHSERSPEEPRRRGAAIHGIQCWVALPRELEGSEPSFEHHPRASIPTVRIGEAHVDVIAGSAFGVSSPVGVYTPTLYAHALLPESAALELDAEHAERAVYVVEGEVSCGSSLLPAGSLAVLHPERPVRLEGKARGAQSRILLLGGAPLDGPRYLDWNFVASDRDALEKAKRDWQNGAFPKIPGDSEEFVPLPNR